MGMNLSEMTRAAGLHVAFPVEKEVTGISEDSRQIQPGWIFVAIPGTTDSGERYAAEATARGAVAVVSETPVDVIGPVILVQHARAALADLAAVFYGYPARRLTCFGVTGTDGKTTTCFLLAAILCASGSSTGLLTTVETWAAGRRVWRDDRLTTPSAPFIQRTIASMVGTDRYAVIECSSHALVQERLRNVPLRAAAITNVASDHIEFHGSQAAYEEAKSRIGELLAPEDRPGVVVNGDDVAAIRVAEAAGARTLTFGLASGASLRASNVETSLTESRFEVEYAGEQVLARVPLAGVHNVYNALAAIGLALTVPLDLKTAVGGLTDAPRPSGRLERVDLGQTFSVYVDYAHTEQAFHSVIRFLSDQARAQGGHLIAVFGAAGDRDHAKRPRLARIATEFCDFFVITNEDPFGEDPELIVSEIAHAAPEATKGRQWVVELDRRRAIELSLERARRGDIVVITGKGHEQSIAEGDRAVSWNDVDVVRELLGSSTTVAFS